MGFLRYYKKPLKLELLTSLLLIVSTFLAIIINNTSLKDTYEFIFNDVFMTDGFSLHMFINDFLMSIFFLVAGLEIKHEILYGNLSTKKMASFPVIAALGGVIVPAVIYYLFNKNTPFMSGVCIPISTDIAFALGIFFIFRKKFDPKLKLFLLSLAIVDDLISIICIGLVYSLRVNLIFLLISLSIYLILVAANKIYKVQSVAYYLISGSCLWYFIHLSGIHSTISGVLLATVIPSYSKNKDSTLNRLQTMLVPVNNLFIIPLFAFANTGISIVYNLDVSSSYPLILGIIFGLSIGKPLGIMLFSYLGCFLRLTEKPQNISWSSLFLVSLLAGIGFTMSIFVSEIAFIHNLTLVDIAKMSILVASMLSIVLAIGFSSLFNIKN